MAVGTRERGSGRPGRVIDSRLFRVSKPIRCRKPGRANLAGLSLWAHPCWRSTPSSIARQTCCCTLGRRLRRLSWRWSLGVGTCRDASTGPEVHLGPRTGNYGGDSRARCGKNRRTGELAKAYRTEVVEGITSRRKTPWAWPTGSMSTGLPMATRCRIRIHLDYALMV